MKPFLISTNDSTTKKRKLSDEVSSEISNNSFGGINTLMNNVNIAVRYIQFNYIFYIYYIIKENNNFSKNLTIPNLFDQSRIKNNIIVENNSVKSKYSTVESSKNAPKD